jgi:hypothetical protein
LAKDADSVKVTILDSTGHEVRSFESSAATDKKKGGQEEESEFGPPRTPPPGRKAGTNRFTWDLRYPGATVFEGEIMWGARAEQGPMAVPGDYQVRVTALGKSETQPLALELDRRSQLTVAQLQEQFRFASQVRDQVSQADEMVIAIRKINAEAKDRAAKVKDEKIAEAGASLRDRFSTIEEDIYQVRNRANEDPLNFPIKLNNQIAALARAIETGDNPPTQQEYEVFKVLSARLEAIVTRYQRALKDDLSRFNTLLVSHGSAEIKPSAVLNTPSQ